MRSTPFLVTACLLGLVQAGAAQPAPKAYDFGGPLKPGLDLGTPAPGKKAAAKKAVKSKSATRPAAAPVNDPFEKARRAQDDYFKRQAVQQEKDKGKETGESPFYKNAPGSPTGGGGGLQLPGFKF